MEVEDAYNRPAQLCECKQTLIAQFQVGASYQKQQFLATHLMPSDVYRILRYVLGCALQKMYCNAECIPW